MKLGFLSHLQKLIKTLPQKPGVYKFKDKNGTVVYVGKAKNLRARVRSYFQKSTTLPIRTRKMLSHVSDFEYIQLTSDLEALFLETNLIKELRPRYNVLMKDDKNFVYIKVTIHEDFPRVTIVRKVIKDGARYFGPKTSAKRAYEITDILRRLFPIRNCSLEMQFIGSNPEKDKEVKITKKTIAYPCLEYHIKRCIAPCINNCTKAQYQMLTSQMIAFLEGRLLPVKYALAQEMKQAAYQKRFEKAAILRDKLRDLDTIMEKQIISTPEGVSQDIIDFTVIAKKAFFSLFQARHGKIIAQENFICDIPDENDEEDGLISESFIKQYYEKTADIPAEIIVHTQFEDINLLEKWLSTVKGSRVRFVFPRQGRLYRLLQLVHENASSFALQSQARWDIEEARTRGASLELAKILGLSSELKRIECYDISHLGGTETVGSMIVFENGLPLKKDYRRFTLRTLPYGDVNDYAALREVLRRRVKYLASSTEKLSVRKLARSLWSKVHAILLEGSFSKYHLNPDYFFGLWKEKTFIGFARIVPYSADICELSSLWIDSQFRGKRYGYVLMTELIRRHNYKRVYVYIEPSLLEYYAAFGFIPIQQIPHELQPRVNEAISFTGISGVLMLLEKRRLYVMKKDNALRRKPDLFIIDGGKGQLSTVTAVLKKENITIPVISLAKKHEEIFVLKRKESIVLPRNSFALHLVQRARDEAHRFALLHQQKRRVKRLIEYS